MRFFTIRETASLLKLSRAKVYELVREGTIPSLRLGKQIRIEEETLRRWIDGSVGLAGGEPRNGSRQAEIGP